MDSSSLILLIIIVVAVMIIHTSSCWNMHESDSDTATLSPIPRQLVALQLMICKISK